MHQTLSIGAVHEGEVLYNISGKEACLTPGSLAVINPETLHTCNPVTEKGRRYYMLHIDAGWCSQVPAVHVGGLPVSTGKISGGLMIVAGVDLAMVRRGN